MIRDTLDLIRLYLDIARSEAGDGTRYVLRNVGIAVLCLLGALFSISVGWLLHNGYAFLVDAGLAIDLYVIPGIIFTGLLVFLFFQDIKSILGSLFLAGDLERLLVSPINTGAIFVARLVHGLRWSYLIILAVIVPGLWVYGIEAGLGWLYFLFSFLILALIPLLSRAVSALLVLFLAHVFPAQRLNEAYMGLLILLALVPSMLILGARDGALSELAEDPEALAHIVQIISNISFPTMGLGRTVVSGGQGAFGNALLGLLLFTGLTVGIFALTVVLAQQFFTSGFLEMSGAGVRKRASSANDRTFTARSIPFLMMVKDNLTRLRDLRLLMKILSAGILYLVVLFPTLLAEPDESIADGEMLITEPNVMLEAIFQPSVGSMALLLFGVVMFISSVSQIAISQEGKQFEILKVAPLDPRTLLQGKWLGVFVPFLFIVTVGIAVLSAIFRYPLIWIGYTWLLSTVAAAGIIMFQIGFTVPGVRLDWEEPAKIGIERGRNAVAVLVAMLLIALFLLIGVTGFGVEAAQEGVARLYGPLIAFAAIAAVSASLYIFSLRYGARRIFNLAES